MESGRLRKTKSINSSGNTCAFEVGQQRVIIVLVKKSAWKSGGKFFNINEAYFNEPTRVNTAPGE